MSSPATGLRYNARLMDGGLTLGITMTAIPEAGSAETLASLLLDELRGRGIVYGLSEQDILRIIRERILDEEVEIGHGTPPRHGTDAELEMLLAPPSFATAADDTGRMDYKNVENVSPVKSGDVISRKTPSDPGEPGVNIFGKPVRPPLVRDAKHPAGKNTVISDDGLEMRAAKDGFLRWSNDKIDVLELYIVRGDVDLRTGNIRYDRDVEVLGDVKGGFEVVAGGDVHVYGNVDGGRVVSEGAGVIVNHGVMGSDKALAMVQAEADIQVGHARFAKIQSKSGRVIANLTVEHSEIRAAGDLILRAGAAMNSVVEVGGKVDVGNVSNRQALGRTPEPMEPIFQASKSNRRQHLRVVISPSPTVRVHGDRPSDVREGVILDLSAGGMRLKLPDRMREGDSHRVQFSLEGVQGTLWMDAFVVRTAAAPAKTGNSYGLKFTHIEPAVRETIARFCMAEDLRQHRAAGRPGGSRH
jgi:hypothetical protein